MAKGKKRCFCFAFCPPSRYDDKKGFYCPLHRKGRTRCLGKGKGRHYPPMDEASRAYLRRFYQGYNLDLESYLPAIGQTVPAWLNEALTEN